MNNNNFCPICKSSNNIVSWTTKYNKNIDSYECVRCDIVFASKILDDNNYKNFYNNYNKERDNKKIKLSELRQTCYENDKYFIDKNCNIPFDRILDIGCGTGKFISLFSNNKIRIGFDIDKNIIENNKKIYKDIYFIDNLNNLDEHTKFNMIIFRGTLQYMRDLNYIKTYIDLRLNKNGYLVILSLPNKNSPLASIQREDWSLYNPLEMFNIFSIKSITNLFNNYTVIVTEFPYIDSPYSNEHQDLKKFIDVVKYNKKIKFPFWGSMINIILKKK